MKKRSVPGHRRATSKVREQYIPRREAGLGLRRPEGPLFHGDTDANIGFSHRPPGRYIADLMCPVTSLCPTLRRSLVPPAAP